MDTVPTDLITTACDLVERCQDGGLDPREAAAAQQLHDELLWIATDPQTGESGEDAREQARTIAALLATCDDVAQAA